MDTFFEQLITIKKTAKSYLACFGITVAALIIIAAAFLFLRPLFIIIAALVVFGAYKLYAMTNIEYEYIITNSSMDIDKIIAKSSRKRILSFDLSAVERVEKYTGSNNPDLLKDCVFACNVTDSDTYLMIIKNKKGGTSSVVIAPEERMKAAMLKFMPKYVGDELK